MQNRFLYFILGISLAWLSASLVYEKENPRPDFAHDYAAGLLIRTGHSKLIYSADQRPGADPTAMPPEVLDMLRARGYNWSYITRFFSHPFYAIMMIPFSFLPYHLASTVFLALQIALIALLVFYLFRQNGPQYTILGFAAILLFYPTRYGFQVGQGSGFLLPIAGYFIMRPQKVLSQIALSVGFLLKPSLLLLPLLFVTERKWRGLLIFTGAWLLASLAAVITLGKGVFLQYISLVLERASMLYIGADMQSALAMLYRIFVGTSESSEINTLLTPVPGYVAAGYYIWVGAVLALLAWRMLRITDAVWRGNMLIIASLLVAPSVSVYCFALLLISLMFLIINRARPLSYILAGAGFLIVNLPRAYYTSGPLLRFLCINLFLGSILIFAGYLIGPEPSSASGGK
ncbi:MAG: glycosyltransferase family 87 protein [candidate division WOR-3 bacterium]